MIKRLPTRNHRSKGIKIKHVLQIILLLGVCFWLIYQIKHSHDKKKEFDENDAKASVRIQNADQIPKLGRKDLQPHKDDQNGKHEEEVDFENIVEEEGNKNEHDEQEEERSEHETEEKQDKHEVRDQEEEEEEENKHGAEEQEEDENKSEEIENEGRGGGDDEIDDNDQEKSEGDGDRDVEFMDEEKEKELTDEKENENNEDEEKEGLVEDQNTHEAREEHYKADDASSAVAHDTLTTSTETEILSSENSDENTEVSVVKQENNSNFTEESITNQNDSGKITKDELKDVNALNTTADQESGNNTLSNSFDSSNTNTTTEAKSVGYLEASSNHTSGSSEQNKMVILPESENSQNTTVDKTATRDVNNGNTEKLEQGNPVREDTLLNTNSTDSVKNENGDTATGESSYSGAGEFEKIRYVTSNETQNDSRNSDTKGNTDASMVEKFKGNTEIVETNGTQNSSVAKLNIVIDASMDEKAKGNTETGEINGTQNISDAKENNDATKDEKSKEDTQTGETDETSETSSGNETSDAVEQDAIDASDNHIHKDVTEVRTDLDTLPDIRHEGNMGDVDETAAE